MKEKIVNRLLAKSYDRSKYGDSPPDYALLRQHSRDVAEACDALANAIGRIALLNAGIDENAFPEFHLTLKADGWIQDLGKANSHFQAMVTAQPEIKQLIRHETLSGILVLLEPRLHKWLSPLSEKLLPSVWGAMGHHRKFDRRTLPEQVPASIAHLAHEDFAEILSDISRDLKLEIPPVFERDLKVARDSKETCDISALESIRDLQDLFEDAEAKFAGEKEYRMLALVKAFGIAADVAASAVAARYRWARNYSLAYFVDESFKIGLKSDDISNLISNLLPPGFITREFQNDVEYSDSFLTLAQAGCGSGKSLAAYMWARKWCEKFEAEGRTNFRLFFCLPTTGTTTEHFKDYALESGISENLISLTHSRSSVDLRTIAETALQEETDDTVSDTAKLAQAALNAERDKIESLALWSTPLVVTTSDTVLGLMSNARRGIYSIPAIMSGAIIFDEIHAFDDQMLGHLLVFLKNFPRLPVLLMTASLPEARRRAIEGVRTDLKIISGPPEFELLERYLIHDSANEEDMWKAVDECVKSDGKVLWVRNRVEWACETYEVCRRLYSNVAVNVYHSRFRYKDRSIRHRRVIDDFKSKGSAAILVATQVAEMSLDLSADLLITDIAPIPSLIQRMGRLNRRSTPDDKQEPKPAIVRLLPQSVRNAALPYENNEIEVATQWLRSLIGIGRPLNQRDLSEAFAKFSDEREYDIAKAEERAIFFSGLWQTRPGQTRGEGHTISVILESDLDKCNERDSRGEPTRDWLRNHEVAIQFKESAMRWDRVGALRVAPEDSVFYDYDEKTKEGTGAKWRR